jgi:hypothetical protein
MDVLRSRWQKEGVSAWLSRVGCATDTLPSHARLGLDRPPALRFSVGRQWVTRNGANGLCNSLSNLQTAPSIAHTFVWSLPVQRTDLRASAEHMSGRAARISDQDQDRALLASVVARGRHRSFRLLDVVPANLGGRRTSLLTRLTSMIFVDTCSTSEARTTSYLGVVNVSSTAPRKRMPSFG